MLAALGASLAGFSLFGASEPPPEPPPPLAGELAAAFAALDPIDLALIEIVGDRVVGIDRRLHGGSRCGGELGLIERGHRIEPRPRRRAHGSGSGRTRHRPMRVKVEKSTPSLIRRICSLPTLPRR